MPEPLAKDAALNPNCSEVPLTSVLLRRRLLGVTAALLAAPALATPSKNKGHAAPAGKAAAVKGKAAPVRGARGRFAMERRRTVPPAWWVFAGAVAGYALAWAHLARTP